MECDKVCNKDFVFEICLWPLNNESKFWRIVAAYSIACVMQAMKDVFLPLCFSKFI